jgi:glycosyltransferase involved in cell wall biosynthesis
MRIGVMLRNRGEHGGGVSVYTDNIVRELVTKHPENEYVLLCQKRDQAAGFEGSPHVTVAVLQMPNKVLWDQVAVPYLARKYGCDVIFNPKYSVPLATSVPKVYVQHGQSWYVIPHAYNMVDRLSHDYIVPRYIRAADGIIAVSNTVRAEMIARFQIPDEKVRTVYHGIDEIFRQPIFEVKRAEVASKFKLPNRFLLFVGQIFRLKNFARLIRAYAAVGPKHGIPLVVAGEHRLRSSSEIDLIQALNLERWVHMIGWVGRHDLPALYGLAEALLFPSIYEGFGIPIVEAMAVGCPVLTSNRYSMAEIAGDAAVLVEPVDVSSIAVGIEQLLADSELRQRLRDRGQVRAGEFSWGRCAAETLRFLREVSSWRERPVSGGSILDGHPSSA